MKDTLPSTLGSFALEAGAKDPSSRYSFQVIGPLGVTVTPVLPGQVLRIGRRRDCEIVIEHPSASRDHALIYGGDPPEIEDLSSNNGTKVQGNLITARTRVPLPAGSVVDVAGTVLHVRRGTNAPSGEAYQGSSSSQLGAPARLRAVVLEDRRMKELYELAERVAATSMSVLIMGETGVGKELFAERVHLTSPRRERPLLRVNCAALAEGVLASELFGHERGAFTGAQTSKVGLFEAANGGTVFLDEIGELTPETQAKLLRVLESGEVTRVGSHQARFVDVRIISATNRDLSDQIGRGRFRSDLYFRLNGVSLMVPPLRERTGEIVPLAEFFAERCASMMGVVPPVLSEKAKTVLVRHRWPGNVRELKNVIERAVVLTPGAVLESTSIQVDMPRMAATSVPPPPASVLPPSSSDGSPRIHDAARSSATGSHEGRSTESKAFDTMSGDRGPRSTRSGAKLNPNRRAEHLRAELARAERDRIIEALQQAGNQAGAAKLLGISRRALIYRLEAHDIPRPRKGAGTKDED